MRAGDHRKSFSLDEDATLRRRLGQGAKIAIVAREMGRARSSIFARWNDLKRRDRAAINHASQPSKLSWAYELGYLTVPPPDYVLRERAIRLTIPPASLGAQLMGDPLPGYSARDNKRREVSVQDALEICALHSGAPGDTITLAKNYGVDQRTIQQIVSGNFFDQLIPSHLQFREWL